MLMAKGFEKQGVKKNHRQKKNQPGKQKLPVIPSRPLHRQVKIMAPPGLWQGFFGRNRKISRSSRQNKFS
jgi:hypothetical protein